jgi:hypothetical protein
LAAGVRPELVTFKLLDVRYGRRFEAKLLNAFTLPATVASGQALGPAIVITVDSTLASAQGSYNLLIEATTPGRSAPQLLEIEIVHPAAKLKAPATLVIDQTLTPFLAPDIDATPLVLGEVSGNSRLTKLTFQSPSFFGDVNQSLKGSLSLVDAPQQLEPHSSISPKYKLEGEFPLGTVKGVMEITSPQLAEPTLVNFEVRTRRASWLLLVIIGAGLIAGYLVRTVLQFQIQLNEARAKGYELRGRLERELKRHPDEEFQRGAKNVAQTLIASLTGTDVKAISEAVETANEALRGQLKELEIRRLAAQTAIDSVSRIVAAQYFLPAQISAIMEQFHKDNEHAQLELDKDNVTGARADIDSLRASIAEQLAGTIGPWKVEIENSLGALADKHSRLPKSVVRGIEPHVKSIRTRLQGVLFLDQTSTVEDIQSTLKAIHDVRRMLRVIMLPWLGQLIKKAHVEFDGILRQANVPDINALDQLQKIVTSFVETLATDSGQPERAFERLEPSQLKALDDGWRQAVLNQAVDFKPTDVETINSLVSIREYIAAADKTAQIWQAMKGGGTMGVTLLVNPIEKREQTEAATFVPYFDTMLATVGLSRIIRTEDLPPEVEKIRTRTIFHLATAKLMQTAIIAILITTAGYLLFESKFVGTFADIVGAFFWGFSLDVTMDTLLGSVKGFRS